MAKKFKEKEVGNSTVLIGTVDTSKAFNNGHVPHRSGAGAHKHKNTKRDRSRGDQKRNAMRDQ